MIDRSLCAKGDERARGALLLAPTVAGPGAFWPRMAMVAPAPLPITTEVVQEVLVSPMLVQGFHTIIQ